MVRIVKGDGTIAKVPFNLKRVPGSFTGEVLCEELMKEITEVRKVQGNAREKIHEHLPRLEGSIAVNLQIDEIKKNLKQQLQIWTSR